MKKRKIKLFASLTSLVMVVAVMAVGIWAATQQTLKVTSTATFTATAISASVGLVIAGEIVDATSTIDGTEGLSKDVLWSFDRDATNPVGDAASATKAIAIVLVDDDTDGYINANDTFTYTFTISNTDELNDLHYEVTAGTEGTHFTAVVGANGEGDIGQGEADVSVVVTFTANGNYNEIAAATNVPSVTIDFSKPITPEG